MSLFLKIGQTSAIFNRLGKIPSDRDLFMRNSRGLVNKSQNVFNILLGMLEGPHDFDMLMLFIISLISVTLTGLMKIEFGDLFERNLLKWVSVVGILASTVLPIFVKNELKLSEISWSLFWIFYCKEVYSVECLAFYWC